MSFVIPAKWWPALAVSAPFLGPLALLEARKFQTGRAVVREENERRIERAQRLSLPSLASLELTVLVDYQRDEGFNSDPAVSYLLRTDRGGVLMDMGLGSDTKTFATNVAKLGIDFADIEGVLITHLHLDHMGGQRSQRTKQITAPPQFGGASEARVPCYVTGPATSKEFDVVVVEEPRLIEAGLCTTGPLSRMFSVLGRMEEQAVVALVEGKGLVVLTGCGHPTIEVILDMVRQLAVEPIYAVVGGLHFPITASRATIAGLPIQQMVGTGKPWWSSISDDDLTVTIAALNETGVQRMLLSAHDTCDHAIDRLSQEVNADVEVLRAGRRYVL